MSYLLKTGWEILLKTELEILLKTGLEINKVRFVYLFIYLFLYLFIYLFINVYTGHNLAVKDTICFVYNKIHWYH